MRRLYRLNPAAAATAGAAAAAVAHGANAVGGRAGAGTDGGHGTNTPNNGGRPNVVQGWACHCFLFQLNLSRFVPKPLKSKRINTSKVLAVELEMKLV